MATRTPGDYGLAGDKGRISGFARTATSGTTGTWGPGIARNEANTADIVSTAGLVIDFNVTGPNGRSSTATAPATGLPYWVFVIRANDGTVAGLLDTSLTPTLPTGYTEYCLIDSCVINTSGLTMRNEWSQTAGRIATKYYVWGEYIASATDAQVALSLATVIPAGAGGTRVRSAICQLSNSTAVANQGCYIRATAAGSYFFRLWAGIAYRACIDAPVLEDNLYLDATDTTGSTLAGQLGLVAIRLERGGSLA